MTSAQPGGDRPIRERLVGLLDYVEQVVRLDERVAFTLADYRLPDGRAAAFPVAALAGLPGVALDGDDEAGALWLAVERLARAGPPEPPADLAPWLAVAGDPERAPAVHAERMVEVDEAGRAGRIAAGACPTAFAPVPPESEGGPPRFQQTLRLADQRSTDARLSGWIADIWAPWAAREAPRRRTIALYERLYRLQQLRETGGAEASVELVWGIGVARWRHAGRVLDRPLIECAVDLELDEADGTLRVRPTTAPPAVDLKPYEELGCTGLALLDEAIRRALPGGDGGEGLTPFRPDGFGPVLALAAARLDPDAAFGPAAEAPEPPAGALYIDDASVLFARPRSAHVLLADIERLRAAARFPEAALGPLATRLVTEPAAEAGGGWEPLSDRLGESAAPAAPEGPEGLDGEVFFPKPFNDDQVAIARRLARGEGLVVQGPPGTGKTHTIANLVCHAMATGQRVLVTSRGEAALAVLRDQLPDKVRSLAIALLSSEREGLGQVEGAIRAVQGAVEGSRPDIRHAAIRRCEAEIVRRRTRLAAIDAELDALGEAQAARIGPRAETPAELALRVAGFRDAFAWFTDRPARYAAETGLAEADLDALRAARRAIGDLLDHRRAALPSPAALPNADTLAGWHAALVRAAGLAAAPPGPWGTLHLGPGEAEAGERLGAALDGIAALLDALPETAWFRAFCAPAPASGRWGVALAALLTDWERLDAGRVEALGQAVELPPGLADDRDAREAVARGVRGERLWPVLALGKAAAKARLGAVRVRGAPVGERDAAAWAAVEARLALADRRRDVEARWRALAEDAGAPAPAAPGELALVAEAARFAAAAGSARAALPAGRLPALEALGTAPGACRALAAELRRAAEVAAGEAAREAAARLRLQFEAGADRASVMACRILDGPLGRPELEAARLAAAWDGLLGLLGRLRTLRESFATVEAVSDAIRAAGAPAWAARLAAEPCGADGDALLPAGWREVWDLAAADAHLARLDARERLGALARERAEEERGVERLFVELVRERTFYALERRLSPSVKSALVEFVRALGRLGKGTGRNAGHQRRLARDAMRRCYAAVPCWIMPTWRVSEQLPATLAAFDLVILDEASQSDVTELPALLRGRKVLVVGDDRQVSPTAPFIPQARIEHLRARHLRGLPFAGLLAPGESLYTLMQAVFPEERLMLREHFRCAEPIIRFSMGFYPEPLVPLRVPSAVERLDPPLIDIYVPHGARDGARKVNPAEADVVVEEIEAFLAEPANARRSVGVISLIGAEQAALIRAKLEERLGAETMQRHAVLCGDSATFQGNERDVVFLSMVADRRRRQSLTMSRYEQRFNVAMSRARDRVVLVRSVAPADLNPADLKARLIAHFAQPMPAPAGEVSTDACESGFERDVMERLLGLGYAVTPQVGALGFRIDLVVEGEGGRRLAVECDGDRFHGPGRWREDMRRQRVLERVGWRFWRCFASSFYADPDGVMADLADTLTRAGITPRPAGVPTGPSPYVSHRVAPPPPAAPAPDAQGELALGATPPKGAAAGDRLTLTFADDRRTMSVLLTEGEEDVVRGLVATGSPIGMALAGCEDGDEVDLPFGAGVRRVMVELGRHPG